MEVNVAMGFGYISTITKYYDGPKFHGEWTKEAKKLLNFKEDLTGDYDNIAQNIDFPIWFQDKILNKWKTLENYGKVCEFLKENRDSHITFNIFESFGEDDAFGFNMKVKVYLKENEDGTFELAHDIDMDRYYKQKDLANNNYELANETCGECGDTREYCECGHDNGWSSDDWVDPDSPD